MRYAAMTGVLGALALLTAPMAASAQRPPTVPDLPVDAARQISPNVHMIAGWPNIGIVVGRTGVLAVDTGLGAPNGAIVAQEAARLAPGRQLYLVTTHYHPEHAGGQNGFPPGTVVVRSRVQQDELMTDGARVVTAFAQRGPDFARLLEAPQATSADIVFDGEHRLDLGGVSVGLYNLGGGHTQGDTVVHVEEDGVLFAGDLIESLRSPSFGCQSCSPNQWLAAVDRIAELNPTIIVPTHGPAPVNSGYIARQRAFLVDLQSLAMAQRAQGRSAEEAGPLVRAELEARYPDWQGLANIGNSVQRAYADPS